MDLKDAKRIVIKVGSALLADEMTGNLKSNWLSKFAEDLFWLRKQGKEVVVVSSGAVALGKKYLGLDNTPLKLEQKQAAAACGQIELMRNYQQYLTQYSMQVAQILITIEDTENRRRYLNARATINTLIEDNVLPIINENDTVATPELRFGDNDRLSARVAQMIEADLLIMLSDIDGMYTANPHENERAIHLPKIDKITDDLKKMAGGSSSNVGSGGMKTKVAAAEIAMLGGCHMVITKGKAENPIRALAEGARCTWFMAHENPKTARKHWIGTSLRPAGKMIVDAGAVAALEKGSSLLPAGVTGVEGQFERGDAVVVEDMQGLKIATGLSNFNSDDAKRIIGKQTKQVEGILGYSGRTEMIHRNELVINQY